MLEEQDGGDGARQGLLRAVITPRATAPARTATAPCTSSITSGHHPSLAGGSIGRMKPRCCGWVSPTFAQEAFPNAGGMGWTQQPGHPAEPHSGISFPPSLPPLSAPNSCDVMYCFPSSNKLHQKKETGIFFFFCSFLAWRSVSKISAALCPCQELISS